MTAIQETMARLKASFESNIQKRQEHLERAQEYGAQAELDKQNYQALQAAAEKEVEKPKRKRGRPKKTEAQANGATESATAE